MPVKRYKGAKARADKLFSEIIRSQGRCEAAGYDGRQCSYQLQTAHIVTRKRSGTRTDLRNAFCLCFAHHRYFTDYPAQFGRFIQTTWAADHYDSVFRRSIVPSKTDWDERVDFLKDIKRALEAKEITIEEAREYEKDASS